MPNNGLSPNKVQLSPVVKSVDGTIGNNPVQHHHQVVVRRQIVNGATTTSPVKLLLPSTAASTTAAASSSSTQQQVLIATDQPRIVAVSKNVTQNQASSNS